MAEELKRIVRSHKDLPATLVSLSINAVNNLSLSEQGQTRFTVSGDTIIKRSGRNQPNTHSNKHRIVANQINDLFVVLQI